MTSPHSTQEPLDEDAELQALRAKRREALLGQAPPTPTPEPGEGVVLWCEAHHEPFRLDETLNRVMASKLLTDALLNDPTFQAQCGRDDAKGTPPDSSRIHTEATRLGPVCCYLGVERTGLVFDLVRAARHRAALQAGSRISQRQASRFHPTVLGDAP